MGPKKLDQHQVTVQRIGVEGRTLSIHCGKARYDITDRNNPVCLHRLLADGNGKGQKQPDDDRHQGWQCAGQTGALDEGQYPQRSGCQECNDK